MRRPVVLLGELRFTSPDQVSGWCMLAEQPQTRATVEILIDGALAIAMVAAQRSDGAGDGRNGFAMTLPVKLTGPATRVIEARERASRQIFARIVLHGEHLSDHLTTRLSGLDVSVLHAPITSPAPPAPDFRAVLGQLGAALWEHGADPWRAARRHLSQLVPRLKLSEAPVLTMVVPAAATAAQSLSCLTALQPLCETTAAEILLTDHGEDPCHVLLPQLIPGLRYLRIAAALTGADLNRCWRMARGEAFALVDPDSAPGRWIWPAWPAATVQLGRRAAGLAAAHMPGGLAEFGHCGSHGFMLRIGRASYAQAGGCDPHLPAAEACAELALKCAVLRVPVRLWLDQPPERDAWPASLAGRAAKSRTSRAPRRAAPRASFPAPP